MTATPSPFAPGAGGDARQPGDRAPGDPGAGTDDRDPGAAPAADHGTGRDVGAPGRLPVGDVAGGLRATGAGRLAHALNEAIGWRGLWLIVTGVFLMLAGIALRQTTSAFFTGQAQPVVSSFRTAVVNLTGQGVQLSISNLVPGALTATSGSLLNGGDVPVNVFLAILADVSSNLDTDATGGLRVAGFRCRNAQALPVPCLQASTLLPIASLVAGAASPVATNAAGGVGLPVGTAVNVAALRFPDAVGGGATEVTGVPVLTANNGASGCAPASEGAACYVGSFGGNPITTPPATVPWGARALDVPEVATGVATAIPGSLEYVVLYLYLPGTAPATMQGQSTTLSFVFAAVQPPGGVDEARPTP